MAFDFRWIGIDWQEVRSACAVRLSACLRVLREAWCAKEQSEITSFALFHLFSFSSDQTLVTTEANSPWDSSLLDEVAKNSPSSCWQSLKAALPSFQRLEKLILRCSARKVQVTMAATVWAALPPGVSPWLHGSDGRLSHSSGSPGNFVCGNVALRQQTALSKAYQGHMQKKWEFYCQISPLS